MRGHRAGLWSVAVNRAGDLLATISQDGTARVWDAATGQLRATLATQVRDNLYGTGVAWTPDGNTAPYDQRRQHGHAVGCGCRQSVLTFRGHRATVTSVAISPDGTIFATGSDDATVKLWDARSGNVLKTLAGHSGNGLVVAFSPDGKRVFAGGDTDGLAIAWDVTTGNELLRFSGQGNVLGVDALTISPDGTRVATGNSIRRSKYGTRPASRC